MNDGIHHELEYLIRLISWRLELCGSRVSPFANDNRFFWRFELRGHDVPEAAEAFAAALYILGEREQAEGIMARFKWGPSFIPMNRGALDLYAAARDSSEVVRIQNEILGVD
mgnify:CR=1 FL=1